MSSLSSDADGRALITPSTRIDGGRPATRYRSLPASTRSRSSHSTRAAVRVRCRIADELSSLTRLSSDSSSTTVRLHTRPVVYLHTPRGDRWDRRDRLHAMFWPTVSATAQFRHGQLAH